eukprot:9232270-Pyramimonas_sp.AAC.1
MLVPPPRTSLSPEGWSYSCMIIYDLSNYYEHANRSELATRALNNGFPATLLRIILTSPRFVALQDLVASVGNNAWDSRGVW